MSGCLSISAGQKAKQSQVKLFLVSLENLQDLTIEFKSASETLPEFSGSSWTSPTAADIHSQLSQSCWIKAQASPVGALSVEGMNE